jgi:oligoribonuclease (3'-5' exoribonuclease)
MSTFGFEGRVEYATHDVEKMAEHARRWRAAGASHVSVNTMHAGLQTVDEHITALRVLAEALL